MRLHLNKTLRAALIAAISVVGFTITQAQAGEYTEAITLPGTSTYWGKGSTSGTNSGFADSTSTINITANAVYATLVAAPNAHPDNLYYGVANGNNFGNGDVVITTADDKSISFNTLARGGNAGEYAAITLSMDSVFAPRKADTDVLTTVTFTFTNNKAAGAYSAWGHVKDATEVVSLGGGAAATKAGVNSITLSLTADVWANMDELVFVIGNDKNDTQVTHLSVTSTFADAPVAESLTWNGSDGNNVLTSSVWNDGTSPTAAYSSSSALIFDTAGCKTVVVDSAATPKSIEIKASGYAFTANEGASLSTALVTVDEGASLALGGAGSYSITNANLASGTTLTVSAVSAISTLTGAGNLVVDGHGNATVTSLSSYTGAMSVTNGGTLNLGSDIILENLTVENGTVTTKHAGSNGVITDTLTIGADGTFKVMGDHDAFGYNNGKTKKIVIGGTNGHMAKLALEQTSGNSVTMSTDIIMNGYAQITDASKNSKGFNTYGGNITVNDIENSIAIIDLRNNVTIDVAAEGTLSVGKFTQNGTNKPAVTKTGAGSMSITDASLLPGTLNINAGTVSIEADTTIAGLNIAADGALAVASGTTTVSGNANVVSHAIGIGAAGILNLTGTYNVSGIAADGVVSYEGSNVLGTDNGFKKTTGKVQVLNITNGGQFSQEGATINYGEAAYVLDETGAFELAGAPDYTTLSVNTESVSFSAAWNIAEAAGKAVSAVAMAANTTLNADKAGASFSLAMSGDATVYATEATTITGITGWSNNKLTITGTGAVTLLSTTNPITLEGSTKLDVQGNVTTKKIIVNSANAALNVAEGATLTTDGNLTPTHGAAAIYGTVNISGELDLSNGKNSDVDLLISSTGKVTANGMWMHSGSSIVLEAEGVYNIGGLSIVGKTDGKITYLGEPGTDSGYGTNSDKYQIANTTVNVTGNNVTLGNTLVDTDVVVANGSSLTLNTDAANVTVENGGTFYLNKGKTVTTITVEDGGTIAGGVDAKKVGIAAQGTATFDEGVNDEDARIYIAGWESGATVTNNGDTTAKYTGLDDETMTVAAETLYTVNADAVEVRNVLEVGVIMHEGTGALTLTQVDGGSLTAVSTDTANLTIGGVEETTLTDLYIGAGATVAVYVTDAEAGTEGTVTVQESLTAGGATLKANLVLAGGSTLDLQTGDDEMTALTLGSNLAFVEGGLVTLDGATLYLLDQLVMGSDSNYLELVHAANGTALAYGEDGTAEYNGMWFGQLFNRPDTLVGDFQVVATGESFGLTKVSNVPEPTTGTLSLLALMALAARRRKH